MMSRLSVRTIFCLSSSVRSTIHLLISGDEVRMRCRDLLLSAIKGEGELPEGCDMENCQELATALEEAIFR